MTRDSIGSLFNGSLTRVYFDVAACSIFEMAVFSSASSKTLTILSKGLSIATGLFGAS